MKRKEGKGEGWEGVGGLGVTKSNKLSERYRGEGRGVEEEERG